METLVDRDLKNKTFSGTSIALGNFDGVHLGHKMIIDRSIELAQKKGGESLIFTFHPHPLQILKGDRALKRISSLEEKVEIIRELGPDFLFIKDFTMEFAKMKHQQFVEEYLCRTFKARDIVVGRDFSFGYKGRGSVETLREMETKYNYRVEALETVKNQGLPIKSTLIRRMIEEGKMEEIETYLGRPFSLSGTVVKGFGRGRMLGFPTANMNPPKDLITPPEGVYVVEVVLGETYYPGVANVGFCPTFNDHLFTIEVHLLGFMGNLYQKKIRIVFLARLRGEIAFSSQEDLKNRVKKDVLLAKEVLDSRYPSLGSMPE